MKTTINHNISISKKQFSTQNFLRFMKNTIALFVFSFALLFAGNLTAQNKIGNTANMKDVEADLKSLDFDVQSFSNELIYQDSEVKVFVKTATNQPKQYYAVNQFGDIVNLVFDDSKSQNPTAASAKKAGSNKTPLTNTRPPIKCKCVKKDPATGLCTEYECKAGDVKF